MRSLTFSSVVIRIEDLLGAFQIPALARLLVPGNGDEPVDIIARDRALGRHRRHGFQPLQLLDRLFLDVLRHPGRFDLLLQLIDFVALVILAAQLLLDRLHVLVEVVLLLPLLHLLFHARLDVPVDLELLHLDLEDSADAGEPFDRRHDLEQVLLFVHADGQVRRNRVGQPSWVLDAERRDHRVIVQVV